MKAPIRLQLKVRLDGDLEGTVRRYCAAHNITHTALVRAALQDYLNNATPLEALMQRLDRNAHEIEQQRRALHLLAEAFGTYVKLWLAHTPEVSADHICIARRDAHARFRRFVDHVVQRLSAADSFFLHFAPASIADPAELDAVRAAQESSHAP